MGPSRSAICAGICAGLFVFASSAKADTTFTLTFIDYFSGAPSGSTTFSLPVTPVVGPHTNTYTPDAIGPIDIAGYSLQVSPADATVYVNPDGSIQFSADTITSAPGGTCRHYCGTPEQFTGINIESSGLYYAYYYAQSGTIYGLGGASSYSFGSYSIPAIAPVALTPEPGSVTLMGTGLLGVVAGVRRRRAKRA